MRRTSADAQLEADKADLSDLIEWTELFLQTGSGVIGGSTTCLVSEALHRVVCSEEALGQSSIGEKRTEEGKVMVVVMSGTELQPMALANVLAGDGLRSLPFWAEWDGLQGWAAIGGAWLSRGTESGVSFTAMAALAMQRRLEAINLELAAAGGRPLKQGIGVHFGEVIAGNLGSPERLEFTVVGAVVNVASRLEGLTRLFPEHPILISGAVLDLLPGELVGEPPGPYRLKGWPDLLDVYALKGIHPSAVIPQ